MFLRQTPRAVTPFGGLSVFIEFLKRIGFPEQVRRDLPVCLKSNNAIPAGETYTAFLIAGLAGFYFPGFRGIGEHTRNRGD